MRVSWAHDARGPGGACRVTPHTTIGVCVGQKVCYYGPDRLGTSWDHLGRAQQHRILAELYQGTHSSLLLARPSRTWTTNLLRHRDYSIGRPSGGFSYWPIIGTDPW
jgi:hypothetical protein